MAPLSKAIRTELAFVRNDGTHVYRGAVDTEWTITVPHGGYILCCVMDALLQYQSTKSTTAKSLPNHPDPAHLTAQFLTASTIGPFQIHVKSFSVSKRWTRLDVSLHQSSPNGSPLAMDLLRIRGHAMFTDLPDLSSIAQAPGADNITVLPNSISPYVRICPISVHPSECVPTKMYPGFKFAHWVRWSDEDVIVPQSESEEKKMEWGCWFELVDESEDVRQSAAYLPFFADMFKNGPEILPADQSPGPSWFPTLTLSLDFKSKFPLRATPLSADKAPAQHSKSTVGLYSYTKFVEGGRHDQTVEVWSAPCAIAEKLKIGEKIEGDWRSGCRILGISTQMALVLPAPGRPPNKKTVEKL